MSTKHNNRLYLRPYEEVDLRVPDIGMRMLPGRVACLSHPVNVGRTVLVAEGSQRTKAVCDVCGNHELNVPGYPCSKCDGPTTETLVGRDRGYLEKYDPDIALVAASGVSRFAPGEVLLLKPDAGSFFPAPKEGWGGSGDRRELRLIGPGWPDRVLAKWTAEGLVPEPGWMVVEREPVGSKFELPGRARFHPYGKCVSGEREGERVVWAEDQVNDGELVPGAEFYTFKECAPKSWALVKLQPSLRHLRSA